MIHNANLFSEDIGIDNVNDFFVGSGQISSSLLDKPLFTGDARVTFTIDAFLASTELDRLIRLYYSRLDRLSHRYLFARNVRT